jgi:hypothetical protein
MTLTERIAVLQRVAEAVATVRSVLAPLPDADRHAVMVDVLAELDRPARNDPPPTVEVPKRGKRVPGVTREPPEGSARAKLVQALADGPMRVQELATAVEASEAAVSQCLRGAPGLFRKVDPSNRMSAWEINPGGPGETASSEPTSGPR